MTDTHETDQLIAVLTDALEIYGRPDDGLPQHLAAVIRRELWWMKPVEDALASLQSILDLSSWLGLNNDQAGVTYDFHGGDKDAA